MKIESAATMILKRHQRCYTVNGVKRSSLGANLNTSSTHSQQTNGGFFRIQDSSQVWEERVDETRIITTEGLTKCLDPGRGWTITSRGWNFLKKQECWEGHEQALIITIRKETKRTEELEEAGYGSPTWTVLRAPQQINSATKIQGEAAMSASPLFQSAGP